MGRQKKSQKTRYQHDSVLYDIPGDWNWLEKHFDAAAMRPLGAASASDNQNHVDAGTECSSMEQVLEDEHSGDARIGFSSAELGLIDKKLSVLRSAVQDPERSRQSRLQSDCGRHLVGLGSTLRHPMDISDDSEDSAYSTIPRSSIPNNQTSRNVPSKLPRPTIARSRATTQSLHSQKTPRGKRDYFKPKGAIKKEYQNTQGDIPSSSHTRDRARRNSQGMSIHLSSGRCVPSPCSPELRKPDQAIPPTTSERLLTPSPSSQKSQVSHNILSIPMMSHDTCSSPLANAPPTTPLSSEPDPQHDLQTPSSTSELQQPNCFRTSVYNMPRTLGGVLLYASTHERSRWDHSIRAFRFGCPTYPLEIPRGFVDEPRSSDVVPQTQPQGPTSPDQEPSEARLANEPIPKRRQRGLQRMRTIDPADEHLPFELDGASSHSEKMLPGISTAARRAPAGQKVVVGVREGTRTPSSTTHPTQEMGPLPTTMLPPDQNFRNSDPFMSRLVNAEPGHSMLPLIPPNAGLPPL